MSVKTYKVSTTVIIGLRVPFERNASAKKADCGAEILHVQEKPWGKRHEN